MNVILEWISPMLEMIPFFPQLLMIMGLLRIINKPLFTFLHTFTNATETPKDNELLIKLQSSKGYRTFLFIIDWFGSVKLKK